MLNTNKKVLVIVDMQPHFIAARDEFTIDNVIAEVDEAKRNEDYIVVLEYHNYGPSHFDILSRVKPYSLGVITEKIWDNGSEEIRKACISKGINPWHFVVCGVNADCCVAETVRGLLQLYPDAIIEIVKDACNSSWSKRDAMFSWMKYHNKSKLYFAKRSPFDWKSYALRKKQLCQI